MIEQIRWLGNAGFFIQGPPLIYINPTLVASNTFLADVILISNQHEENLSLGSIHKLTGPQTQIYTNTNVVGEIENSRVIRPWQSIMVERAGIKAIPAYSTDHVYHPQTEGGLGFLISVNYFDIYYAGDTQIIPEMSLLHPDIAILPIAGKGTLTVEEAVEVVKFMRPRWVIPYNWDASTQSDARRFKMLVSGRAEVILPANA